MKQLLYLTHYTMMNGIKLFRSMCREYTGTKYKIKEDLQGIKKLAYPIKKQTEGYYVLFTWQGTPDNVVELERCLRINDNVLKFMTVKTIESDSLEEYAEGEYDKLLHLNSITEDASEQSSYNLNLAIDAMDVILGFADYTKRS